MIPKERDAFERWVKRAEEIDEGLAEFPPAGATHLIKRFPIPDTSGLTLAEAEAVLEEWRAGVNAAMAQSGQHQSETGGTLVPATDPTPTQAPVA